MNIPIGLRALWLTFVLIVVAAIGLAQVKGEPSTVTGSARIIDADTVVVHDSSRPSPFRDGVHIRLLGVDAAEMNDPIGQHARDVMITIVGDSPLTCELTGQHTWNREVGVCFTASGLDINQAIIERGAALACARYSAKYLPFEQPSAVAAQQRATYCVRR